MKVVILHHWLVAMRGGEKVLEELIRLYPECEILTLVHIPGSTSSLIESRPIRQSLLGKLPVAIRKRYKSLLPLHPFLTRRISVPQDTDLVISTDAAMIKGIPIPEGVRHICYCHSPPRYLWGLQEQYETGAGALLKKRLLNLFGPGLREFDRKASLKVDTFIANSAFVAARIRKSYGRDSQVVYPPVDVADFSGPAHDGGYYLLVSQLTPYKKAEIAVRSFTEMNKQLVVIGSGEEIDRLRNIAGPTVDIRGRRPWSEVREAFMGCKAFLYPQIEDFGITAVEAQAAGKPVIAFAEGGALETVIDAETGILFHHQSVESLSEAVHRFETGDHKITPERCRLNAARFNPSRFRKEIEAIVDRS